MTAPSNELGSRSPEHSGLPPMFRVGTYGITNEYIDSHTRKHILSWDSSPADSEISEIAGWKKFAFKSDGFESYLVLPESTRNASGVLGGVEAWMNEKKEIVEYFFNYLDQVLKVTGKIDTHAGFDSLGVYPAKRGHDFFIAPPHILTKDSDEIAFWAKTTADDLRAVLEADPNKENLVNLCEYRISSLMNQG